MTLEEHIFDIPSEQEQNVFGQFDAYLKKIERTTGVSAITRDGGLKLIGSEVQVEQAKQVLLELLELSGRGRLQSRMWTMHWPLPWRKRAGRFLPWIRS